MKQTDVRQRHFTLVHPCKHANAHVVSQINTGGCELCCPSVGFAVAGAPINIPPAAKTQQLASGRGIINTLPYTRTDLLCDVVFHDVFSNGGMRRCLFPFSRRSTVNRNTTSRAS